MYAQFFSRLFKHFGERRHLSVLTNARCYVFSRYFLLTVVCDGRRLSIYLDDLQSFMLLVFYCFMILEPNVLEMFFFLV